MRHRYGAITTATLAALVLGTAPAMAQISKGLDGNVKPSSGTGQDSSSGTYNANPSGGVSGNAGVSSTDAIAGAKKSNEDVKNPSASPNSNDSTSGSMSGAGNATTDQSSSGSVKSDHSASGSVKSNESVSGSLKSEESTSGSLKSDESASGSVKSDESPSASPSMGDDKAISNQDDRDRMKQQEQLDKKSGLDRADQAAGPHGAEGRANARTRGTQQ
jgi:hypothetical protein